MAKTLAEHNYFDFDATIVADSVNLMSDRLTTLVVTAPRIVLAEFNTHRAFTRNSASSRAIPFKKMVDRVQTNPFVPVLWQKDHKGMQGTEYFGIEESKRAEALWLEGRDGAIDVALCLNEAGLTKQLCNRPLETYLWHTIVVSATEWENFFDLRCPLYSWEGVHIRSRKQCAELVGGATGLHMQSQSLLDWFKMNDSQADVHIQLAAEAIWDAQLASTPKELKAGEYHIPFAELIDQERLREAVGYIFDGSDDSDEEFEQMVIRAVRHVSIATCAKWSYGNVDVANSDYIKDIELYNRIESNKHASPFEHVARSMSEEEYHTHVRGLRYQDGDYEDAPYRMEYGGTGWCRNFKGFIQERHLLGL